MDRYQTDGSSQADIGWQGLAYTCTQFIKYQSYTEDVMLSQKSSSLLGDGQYFLYQGRVERAPAQLHAAPSEHAFEGDGKLLHCHSTEKRACKTQVSPGISREA